LDYLELFASSLSDTEFQNFSPLKMLK